MSDSRVVYRRQSSADFLQPPIDAVGPATVVFNEELPNSLRTRLLNFLQSRPTFEKVADDRRTDFTEPVQDLRKIQFQIGRQTIRVARFVIDELPPSFDQELKRACLLGIWIEVTQLFTMTHQYVDQQTCIRRIALAPEGRKPLR